MYKLNPIFKYIILLSMPFILSSCAGLKKADGPVFTDTPISKEEAGRIVLYMPSMSLIHAPLRETMVYVNNRVIGPINLEGHHILEVKPGAHVITLIRRQSFGESIAFNIKSGETKYIRYALNMTQTDKKTGIIEAGKTKQQFYDSQLIETFPMPGNALIASRSNLMHLKLANESNTISGIHIVKPGKSEVEVNISVIIEGKTYTQDDNVKLIIDAKKSCIYMINHNIKNFKAYYYTEEFCQS